MQLEPEPLGGGTMIYGYSRRIVDEEFGLLELREVTFDLEPSDLRALASFLVSAADQIEAGTMRDSHVHIESESPAWNSDAAGADVVVSNPKPGPPIPVG